MKKLIFFSIMVFAFSFNLQSVSAKELTLGDLRVRYEEALAKKSQYDSLSNEAKKEIANKEDALKDALSFLANVDSQILSLEENIRVSNEKIEQLKEQSKKVLQYLQVLQGENAYLEFVADSSGVSDLLRRIEAVKEIIYYVEDTLATLDEEVQNNAKLILELKLKKEETKKDVVSYQSRIENLYGNLENYDKYALSINEEYEVLKKQYETYQNLCLMNAGRVDDAVLIEDCNVIPINGGWMKPLESGHITCIVGVRYGTFHDGIDIGGNLEGTPVYSAATGVVKAIVPLTSCGGNRVYINALVGGEEYTIYYYHLLQFGDIQVGDIVTQDTVIGYVGGGRSTSALYGGYDYCTSGTHLHFGVQKGWSSSINIIEEQVIVPPGFLNSTGYSFSRREDFYN